MLGRTCLKHTLWVGIQSSSSRSCQTANRIIIKRPLHYYFSSAEKSLSPKRLYPSSAMPILSTTYKVPSSCSTMKTSCCDGVSPSTSSSSSFSSTPLQDIEDLHQQAVLQGAKSYEDPETGFTVFTEIFHLQRGTCCGNQCRHCPYGWENVAREDVRRRPKVKSGDRQAVRQLLEDIKTKAAANNTSTHSTTSIGRRKKKFGGTHGGRLTEKNVPYTKKGDQGTSQLLTGERRSKNDTAFEAMGTVDELCSVVGVAHSLLMEREQVFQKSRTNGGNTTVPQDSTDTLDYGELPDWLLQVMSRLFDAGSHIAKPVRRRHDGDDEDEEEDQDQHDIFQADGVGGGMSIQHVESLEDWIDTMTEPLPELRNFILPTGSLTAAQFHVCRTVCRRAERSVVPLVDLGVCDPNVLKYLNRLSDFFFVASRWCNFCQGTSEIEYRRPEKRDKQRVATAKDLNPSR